MTERTLSLSEVQEQLTTLPQLFQDKDEPIIVTQDDVHVMAILSMSDYQQMCETIETLSQTLEILHDEKFMTSFLLSQKGMKKEPLISLDQIRQELDWGNERTPKHVMEWAQFVPIKLVQPRASAHLQLN